MVVWIAEPLVPMTVMVKVLIGVVGLLTGDEPQPVTEKMTAIIAIARTLPVRRLRCSLLETKSRPSKAKAGAADHGVLLRVPGFGVRAAMVVGTWMVRTEDAPATPGVMLAGRKVATAPTGSPDAVRLMVLLKVPPCEVALMV